jgi:hypothetical protein
MSSSPLTQPDRSSPSSQQPERKTTWIISLKNSVTCTEGNNRSWGTDRKRSWNKFHKHADNFHIYLSINLFIYLTIYTWLKSRYRTQGSDPLRAEWLGVQTPVWRRDFLRSSCGAHPAPSSMDIGVSFRHVKRPGREADRSSKSCAEVKNKSRSASAHSVSLHGVDRDNLNLYLFRSFCFIYRRFEHVTLYGVKCRNDYGKTNRSFKGTFPD